MKHNSKYKLSLLAKPTEGIDKSYYESLHPMIPSKVYDTYWKFAFLRQQVFYNKLRKTDDVYDPIIKSYKFTNVYRASDRVSQYLINNVIYSGMYSPEDIFYRIILFKMFNKIETWELIESQLGEVKYSTSNHITINHILDKHFASGNRIYSAAYIMPSGGSTFQNKRKHTNHLMLIDKMMNEKVWERIEQAPALVDIYKILLSYPSIGPFLAYQFSIDLNYSELVNFDENDFVAAGPGAISGIAKCFISTGGMTHAEVIEFMQRRQTQEFDRLGLEFRPLGSRMPTLIDCQNIFCEVDKYSRIAHPDIVSAAKRTRIKQKYKPHTKPIVQFRYPPKWGINEEFEKQISVG